MAPCLTPLHREKTLETTPFQRTLANWKKYMNMYSLRKSLEKPLSRSFRKSSECLTISKALVMSVWQVNTSDPFLKKYPTVSIAIQVHTVVEVPSWYAYCKSSRPRQWPKRRSVILSISFSIRLLIHSEINYVKIFENCHSPTTITTPSTKQPKL